MRKLLASALGGAAILGLASSPSFAVLQIALDINGAVFTCVDNAACDTNSAVGTLQTAQTTFNGVTFLGSSQTQLTGSTNELTTTSFQITNTNGTAVTYQLAVGGTGFVGPVTTINESGSGTFTGAIGSTITQTYWADTGNTQGADTPTDLPGAQQFSSSYTATLLNDSFNQNHTSSFTDADLFSMTEGASGTLVAGGQLTGRSQSMIAFQTTTSVPEPGTLGLLGAALAGMALFLRRRALGL